MLLKLLHKIMTQNFLQKIYHAIANINLTVESEIMINADATVKNIYVKKIVFGILLHVVEKMKNI